MEINALLCIAEGNDGEICGQHLTCLNGASLIKLFILKINFDACL